MSSSNINACCSVVDIHIEHPSVIFIISTSMNETYAMGSKASCYAYTKRPLYTLVYLDMTVLNWWLLSVWPFLFLTINEKHIWQKATKDNQSISLLHFLFSIITLWRYTNVEIFKLQPNLVKRCMRFYFCITTWLIE